MSEFLNKAINGIKKEVKTLNEGISFGNNMTIGGQKSMDKPIGKVSSINPEMCGDDLIQDDFGGDEMIEQEIKTSTSDFENEVSVIREIALKSIAKLAKNPLSDEYIFFKKIWAECDKIITDTVKKNTTPSTENNNLE